MNMNLGHRFRIGTPSFKPPSFKIETPNFLKVKKAEDEKRIELSTLPPAPAGIDTAPLEARIKEAVSDYKFSMSSELSAVENIEQVLVPSLRVLFMDVALGVQKRLFEEEKEILESSDINIMITPADEASIDESVSNLRSKLEDTARRSGSLDADQTLMPLMAQVVFEFASKQKERILERLPPAEKIKMKAEQENMNNSVEGDPVNTMEEPPEQEPQQQHNGSGQKEEPQEHFNGGIVEEGPQQQRQPHPSLLKAAVAKMAKVAKDTELKMKNKGDEKKKKKKKEQQKVETKDLEMQEMQSLLNTISGNKTVEQPSTSQISLQNTTTTVNMNTNVKLEIDDGPMKALLVIFILIITIGLLMIIIHQITS